MQILLDFMVLLLPAAGGTRLCPCQSGINNVKLFRVLVKKCFIGRAVVTNLAVRGLLHFPTVRIDADTVPKKCMSGIEADALMVSDRQMPSCFLSCCEDNVSGTSDISRWLKMRTRGFYPSLRPKPPASAFTEENNHTPKLSYQDFRLLFVQCPFQLLDQLFRSSLLS